MVRFPLSLKVSIGALDLIVYIQAFKALAWGYVFNHDSVGRQPWHWKADSFNLFEIPLVISENKTSFAWLKYLNKNVIAY